VNPATVQIGYEPAAPRPCSRDIYHVILDQPTRIGGIGAGILRESGQPLCGSTARLAKCPPGLFPPVANCPVCIGIARREGIETGNGPMTGDHNDDTS
jgi:hypothetical protein